MSKRSRTQLLFAAGFCSVTDEPDSDAAATPRARATAEVVARDDLALTRRAIAGDAGAREALVERFRCVPRFLAWRNRRYGFPFTAEELEDVQQEILFEAWRKLPDYEGRGPLEAWLQRFTFNVFVFQLRKRFQRPRSAEESQLVQPTEDSSLDVDLFERELVHRTIDRLGPPDSDLVRLRHLEDLSFEEAAERVGMIVATAKTRYYRALAKLRNWLEPTKGTRA